MANYQQIAALQFQKNSEYDLSTMTNTDVVKQFNRAAERLDGTGLDILITCEGMESVGQSMEQAESYDEPGLLLNLYADFARRNSCCVVGSVKLQEGDAIYNAQVMFDRDGSVAGDYRKVFLTDGEVRKGMSQGGDAKVISTSAGKIGGAICFDLNFTELRMRYNELQPDVLAFSSMYHGGLVQNEWAFQCRCFFASSCKDGVSQIIDPLGRIIATSTFYSLFARAKINLDRFVFHGDSNSPKVPDLYRKYGDKIRIDTDPVSALHVLYSECDSVTAKEIAEEFGMKEVNQFFRESRNNNKLFKPSLPGY